VHVLCTDARNPLQNSAEEAEIADIDVLAVTENSSKHKQRTFEINLWLRQRMRTRVILETPSDARKQWGKQTYCGPAQA